MVNDTARSLSILHVTAPARVGGLESVVDALTVGHARAGHAVHVAAVVEREIDAEHFLRPLAERGVHVHALVLPGRAYLRERAAIGALCRAIRPTVMHTHGYRADVIASGAARGLAIPTVTTVHGFTGGSWRNRLYETLQLRAFRGFDAVVAVSRPLADLLRRRGVPADRLQLIVNAWGSRADPIDRATARARLGMEGNQFTIGWLGRLSREKGADVLIDALALLPEDVSASFIGDGRERDVLAALADSRGVAERVRWHGIVAGAGALLPAVDAFVLSSRTEGTPMTLFEAMDARVPIVATRVGGVPDVVTDAEALLVPAGDPTAIAMAVQTIRREPAAAAVRVAAASQRLTSAFAVEPWLNAYEQLYRRVAGP
jgi:glycosyltransferase involved in cell wall biosynthesis